MTCAHIVADKVCTWRFYDVLDKDDDYAFQFVAKADSAKTVTLFIGDQETTFNLTSEFALYKHVFEGVSISSHPYLDVTFPVGNFFIGRTQLEHGTVVTDWQRSQDDDKNSITKLWSALTITAEEIRSEVHASYHVTNMVPTTFSREYTSGDEWTPSNGTIGLKWTLNDDDSVTAEALNEGVATTGQSAYAISGYSLQTGIGPIALDTSKQYTITGCPADGSKTGYYVRARVFAENEIPSSSAEFEDDSNQFYDLGEGLTLEAGWAYLTLHLVIASGYIIPEGGITFYPMVVEGTDSYPYVQAEDGDVSTWSMIRQNANKIGLVVGSDNSINAASIALAINSAGSSAAISADKIGISGSALDLTGKNISIQSTNFSVSPDGTVTAKSANITGGSILINTTSTSATDIIRLSGPQSYASMQVNGFYVRNNGQAGIPWRRIAINGGAFTLYGDGTEANIDQERVQILTESMTLKDASDNYRLRLNYNGLQLYNSSGIQKTAIYPGYQYFYNDSGTMKVGLSQSGLFFYDDTGTVKTTYPADGFDRSYEEADNVATTSGTWKTVGYHYFYPGKYLVEYVVGFESNANGNRYAIIADSTSSETSDVAATRDTRNATNGRWTYTRITHIYEITTAQYKYFRVIQNSGQALNCNFRMYALKLV